MSTTLGLDRRSTLKARHRQAIVDAARRLIDERQGPRFSVDELAREADLSRRTVFNHFESLDDVILTVCAEVLDPVVAPFREAASAGAGGIDVVFADLVGAVRRTDLPGLTAYLWSALGGAEAPPERQQRFMQIALARVADDLVDQMRPGSPGADPMDVELLVSSLLHGVAIIGRRWVEEFAGATDAAARDSWDALMDHLVARLRSGFGTTS